MEFNYTRIDQIEPEKKLWFAIDNGNLYALPLFGDYAGPFHIHMQTPDPLELKLKFHFAPSASLFSPSNHLLLALFNLSSMHYRNSSIHRYHIIRTLSLALNLSDSLLTIHKINGSMIKVYFSCDLYSSTDLAYQIKTLINSYYSQREHLAKEFPLPLMDISIVRLSKSSLTTSTHLPNIELKKADMKMKSPVVTNRTVDSSSRLLFLDQFYQPLVLIPLAIILIGLFICTIIAFCLCCHRRSSSSSTLLLPSGPTGQPNNKHLYQNYIYRQQQETYRKKFYLHDQRQYISKGRRDELDSKWCGCCFFVGIPVVFAEELEEKLEQTHTPLVMRIEKPPYECESDKGTL